jgi:hypothetical protein
MGKGKKESPPDTTAQILDSIDFKDSIVTGRDIANEGMQGYFSPKTLQFPMVQTTRLAAKIADRELKKTSYALADLSFKANRNMFKAVPGMLYNLSYPLYDIESMVVRILKIEEEGPESEIITIYAYEDAYYAGKTCIRIIPNTRPDPIVLPITTIDHVLVLEQPYTLADGENIKLGVVASREEGNELGYAVYASNDGVTYTFLGTSSNWGIYGVLQGDYPKNTITIDDDIGFEILFDNDDATTLETMTRGELFGNRHLCLLGSEFISFQTITPISDRRYKLEGVLRGKFDTLKQDHSAGEAFFFIGDNGLTSFTGTESTFYHGATRYYKIVPFNMASYGSLSDATAHSILFNKRAFTPYSPDNLRANGCGLDYRATYTTDVVLTWATRIRSGQGCGYSDIDTVVDAAPTWEGLFEIEVYVGGTLVRTATAINDDTWTYTEAMNLSDNGSLASEITFKITDYLTSGAERYDSDELNIISLIVRLES